MRTTIINGLAQVVTKSARMAQTGILTRNPTSPVPTQWPDSPYNPAILRVLRLTTGGMAWSPKFPVLHIS